ncbi:MAG: prenyltransferase/squalene oxidase repeat-containing protein [Planctomycetota bacterium]|nr:prenyltransferase/squalene oxidase repeat-containing protein [Planctomycetota bacterium]
MRPLPVTLLFALLAVLALGGGAADAKGGAKELKPLKIKNDLYPEAFRKRVNAAVDEGVEYLMKRQAIDGSWPANKALKEQGFHLGHTALMTLACLKGGLTKRDPGIRKAVDWMRTQKIDKTYSAGVVLMAIHALYNPSDERSIVKVDKYGQRKIEDPCLTDMIPKDRALMKKALSFLLKNQHGGNWRYPGSHSHGDTYTEGGFDLSNTQYALLGLWAASRCGFKIPSKVWMDSLDWLLKAQERTGRSVKLLVNEVRGDYRVAWTEKAKARGFRYIPGGSPTEGLKPVTGSMTTAGMACVAICQDELWGSRRFDPKMRKLSRRSIRDALAWMQDNFDVTRNPGEPGGGWHFYYLYGMERAGILARCRFMGKHDWYKSGADWLLAKQRSNGSWSASTDEQLDTAFAILFLKRSTTRARNPAITVPSR